MVQWLVFLMLCLIWGSSFIMMKLGLGALSPFEVAGLRLLTAGLALLPFFPKAWKNTGKRVRIFSLLIGLLGSFFPGILFCMAQTTVHSSLAGILNATTPLFVMLVGFIFFKRSITVLQFTGIAAGFLGVLLLFFPSLDFTLKDIPFEALLILPATVMYGFNVNIANRHLSQATPLYVATLSLVLLIPLDLSILIQQDFFNNDFTNSGLIQSALSAILLGLLGTALATWLFYVLMQKAGPVFASMVTYGIPFVALGWGLLAGEHIAFYAICALILILVGVYLTNLKKSP